MIDRSLIKNGDLFLIRRLDGYDAATMIMTGGHAAHAGVAIWDDSGDLYILESQAKWYF